MPADRPDYQVHWLVTGGALGGASWSLIGAVVAAALTAWTVALVLVLIAVALVLLLVSLGRAVRRLNEQPASAGVARTTRLVVARTARPSHHRAA